MLLKVEIIPAIELNKPRLYEMFIETASAGTAFMHNNDTTVEEWSNYWFGKGVKTFVAILNSTIVGSYIIKANNPGFGSHVANCSYLVSSDYRSMGIGRLMGEHSIAEAQKLGFEAMQFNAVVSSNTAAIKLWKNLDFEIVGRNPKAFNHNEMGAVDTFTMYLGFNRRNSIGR